MYLFYFIKKIKRLHLTDKYFICYTLVDIKIILTNKKIK